MSAGQVTDKGNSVWLAGDGGYILEKDSYVQKCVQMAFDKAIKDTKGHGAMKIYKENGIYNLYVQAGGNPTRAATGNDGSSNSRTTLDICAGTHSDSRAAPRVPGGRRQGQIL